MKKIFLIGIVSILTGCVQIFKEDIKDYYINQLVEIPTGNPMIGWGYGEVLEALRNTPPNGEDNVFSDGIKKELYYDGISQNVIHLSYREFNLNPNYVLARMAFNRDLQYDLSLSADKVIVFQQFKIRIDSADNKHIKFVVLEAPTIEMTGSIGIFVGADGVIAEVEKNSSAFTAGILKGDKILKINQILINEQDVDYIVSKIDGLKGTSVQLVVQRLDGTHTFNVIRE